MCSSDVHAITPAFHSECRPVGAFDDNGEWLCVGNRSCESDLRKRNGRIAAAVERAKLAKQKLDATKAKKERNDRDKQAKASLKPPAPVPTAVLSRTELPPPVDVSQTVGNLTATVASAVAAGFRIIIPQQLGPVATPTPDKHEILTLTCNWQVENEVRADRLTKEARNAACCWDRLPPPLLLLKMGEKRKKRSSKKHKKENKSRKRQKQSDSSSSGSSVDSHSSESDSD